MNFPDNSLSAEQLQRWQQISLKVHEHYIKEAWERLENAGFKPLLLKGWSAARYYDEPSERSFNDLDLAFDERAFEQVERFLKKNSTAITIDLHKGLKHLDTMPFEYLYSRSQLVECAGIHIRVLSPEDHLRVLCVHWLNDGGAKKDKLRDVFYAVKNRPGNFDWDKCLNVVSPIRRRWIVCAIGLAHRYLGLDLTGTPIKLEAEIIPNWLVNAVEKEWASETVIVPLHLLLRDREAFFKQLKKRVPPNPIQATIEMEGDFDRFPRVFYQIGSVFYRFPPFIDRLIKRLKTNPEDF